VDCVSWTTRPTLRSPVVVAAFSGWNDAGDAATAAARHLVQVWQAERFAEIDPEEFYDFTQARPMVRLRDGVTRELRWPANEFAAATTTGGPDVVLLVGTEPHLRWRTYCAAVLDVADALGASLVVTLGALLADVPHTRPVQLIGTGTDPDLIARHGLQRSRYEGPTGIVGTLHDACATRGVASLSLWAATPAYVPGVASPKASLALVERLGSIIGTTAEVAELARASRRYVAEVDEHVRDDDDLGAFVARLEEAYDAGLLDDSGADDLDDGAGLDGAGLDGPIDATLDALGSDSGEQLVEDIERFLRDQRPDR
jgi:proteasome assembly chaperone (PAC2) family protein